MRQSNGVLAMCLFSCSGCQDPAPAAPSPVPLPAPPSDSPPRAVASVQAPPVHQRDASPEGAGTHYVRCATGFHLRSDARVDVRRLGMTCGPSNGMVRWGDVMRGRISELGAEGRHELRVPAGDCVRLVIVAERGVGDLEVELSVSGAAEARVLVEDRWALLPSERPYCPETPVRAQVTVRTHSGSGDYFLEGWRQR